MVSFIQQYFNNSITVLTNPVWKLLIALFGAFTVPNFCGILIWADINPPVSQNPLIALDFSKAQIWYAAFGLKPMYSFGKLWKL